MVEVTFFPRAYDDFRRFMEQPDAVVIIQGKVDTARGGGRPAASQAVDEELDAEEEEQEAVTLIADAVWDWSRREDIEPLERQRMVHVEVPDAGPDVVKIYIALRESSAVRICQCDALCPTPHGAPGARPAVRS